MSVRGTFFGRIGDTPLNNEQQVVFIEFGQPFFLSGISGIGGDKFHQPTPRGMESQQQAELVCLDW